MTAPFHRRPGSSGPPGEEAELEHGTENSYYPGRLDVQVSA